MTASVIEVYAGVLKSSQTLHTTADLSNAIVAGDVVVALIACNASGTNHSVAGLGATWTRVGKDALGLLDLWVGTGATTTGTVTATLTTSVSGGFKYLNLWHVRGTTSAFIGGADNATGDTLVSASMAAGPGQVFIGSGYSDSASTNYMSSSPATGWVESTDLTLASGRLASRVHRIPSASESHYFTTFRSGSTAHPIVRVVVGSKTRTNLLTNPSFEANTAGWTPEPTRSASEATASIAGAYNAYGVTSSLSAKAPATAGLSYVGSGWFTRTTTTLRAVAVTVHFYDATNAELDPPTVTETNLAAADVPERRSMTRTAPAGTTQVALKYHTTTVAAIRTDAFLLEQSGTLGDYFDGSILQAGYAHAWTGTPHASTSTEQVVASRINLVTNPSFETDVTGWTNYDSTTLTRESTVGGHSGSYAMKVLRGTTRMTVTHGTTTTGASNGFSMPVTAGQTVTVSMYVRQGVGSLSVFPMIFWQNTNGAFMSSASGTTVTVDGTWQRISMTATAPTNAKQFGFGARVTTTASGDYLYVDDALAEITATLGSYFDGSTVQAGYTYTWTGTAHASASIEVVGETLVTVTVKHRESGAWVEHTAVPKVRVAGAWETIIPQRWNSSAWVDLE